MGLDGNSKERLLEGALPRFVRSDSYRILTDASWMEPDEDYGIPGTIPQEAKDRLSHLHEGWAFIGDRDGDYVVVWEYSFPCFDRDDVFEAALKWECGLAEVPNSLEVLLALEGRCAAMEALYPGVEFHSGLDEHGSPCLVAFGRPGTPSLKGTCFDADMEALPAARKMADAELREAFGDAYDALAEGLENAKVEAVLEAFAPRP